VTLGLRYEYQTPYNDIYNNLADFNVATGKSSNWRAGSRI